jgi:acetoin utilization protein AcuA
MIEQPKPAFRQKRWSTVNTACHEPVISKINANDGVVYIEGPVDSEYLANLDFDEHLNNFRSPERQKQCLCKMAGSMEGFLYIARFRNTVVGYVTFHSPDPYTRWNKHPLILELGAIEISPHWRRHKIGWHMLQKAFANPLMADRIVITMEYCWHWDLEKCGLTIWEYQLMLTKLLGSVGLRKVITDDPEINEHPANVLMARIGENVTEEYIELFEMMKLKNSCHM